jgi:hypothetical protein
MRIGLVYARVERRVGVVDALAHTPFPRRRRLGIRRAWEGIGRVAWCRAVRWCQSSTGVDNGGGRVHLYVSLSADDGMPESVSVGVLWRSNSAENQQMISNCEFATTNTEDVSVERWE